MMDETGFNELIDEIMSQGFDEETAARYAKLIGDRPIIAGDGSIIVTEDGEEITRLKPLKFFTGE